MSFIPVLRYTPAARLSEVVYDSTLVTFTYDDASGTVKTIHLTHNGFISSIRYRQTGTFKNTVLQFQCRQKLNQELDLFLNLWSTARHSLNPSTDSQKLCVLLHSDRVSVSAHSADIDVDNHLHVCLHTHVSLTGVFERRKVVIIVA